MDEVVQAQPAGGASGAGRSATGAQPSDDMAELLQALGTADTLPLDQRLELLRDTEARISKALEGLDGL